MRFVELQPAQKPPLRPIAVAETGKPEPPESDQAKVAKAGERIAKYIPAEIVGGYSILIPACKAVTPVELQFWLAVVVFFALWISTPLYLVYVQRAKPEYRPQVAIATISFLGWAYSLGGPFAMEPLTAYYNQPAGMLIAGLFSVLVGLFYAPKESSS